MRAAAVRYGPVLALTLLGAVLRFPTLDRQSFWLDELVTASLLDRGLGDVAPRDPADRGDAVPLLRRRVALELGLRARRGRLAVALRARGDRDDPGRVRGRGGSRVPASGHRRGRARRDEPVPRLVLAGGAVVRAVCAARSDVGAHLRARAPWRPSLAGGVGRGLRPHARHALLRGLPRRRGGRLAARAPAAAAPGRAGVARPRRDPPRPSARAPRPARQRRSGRGLVARGAGSPGIPKNLVVGYSFPLEAAGSVLAACLVLLGLVLAARLTPRESGGERSSQARSRLRSCSSRSCSRSSGGTTSSRGTRSSPSCRRRSASGRGSPPGAWAIAAAALLCALCTAIAVVPAFDATYGRTDWRGAAAAHRADAGPARHRRHAVHEPVALAPVPARAGRARTAPAPSSGRSP